jgi:DNA repair exonuclease SbcCD ATPase subunit
MRRLYRLPLGEFTAVRNSLAKQLQKKGEADAANEVKALPKPSVSAWAVNQLFAREADHMRALLAAGEQARSALQHTLTVGDAEVLREALQEQREQRDALRHRAAEILTEDLRAPGQAILDRVTVNLDALALSPGAAEEAARGWLSHDLEPPGFEVLSGLRFAARHPDRRGLHLVPSPRHTRTEKKPDEAKPDEKKPAAKAEPAPRRDSAAEKAAAETERRRKAEEAVREREETRRRARIERAQEKSDRLAAEADTLRRDAERAEREAAEAERAAQEAARRATLAREDADRIRRRAERATADAERAERDLETARRLH